MRYQEEILHLEEEKRRVVVSLQKTAAVWDARERSVLHYEPSHLLQEGLTAYAAEQASLNRRLAARFQELWNMGVSERAVEGTDDGQEAEGDSELRYTFGADNTDDEGITARGDNSDDE